MLTLYVLPFIVVTFLIITEGDVTLWCQEGGESVFKRGTVADASCLAWGFMVRGRCLIVCSVVANDPVRGRAYMYCIYIVYVVW